MVIQSADRIYIIEDDDDLRRWLARGLADSGLKVKSFVSNRDFLEALPELRPGCVLADLRMPGGGAIELLEQLASQWMAFPIIVMTAFSDVAVAVTAMKRGAFDFIEKPFSESAVIELIRSVQKRVDGAVRQRRQADGLDEIASRRLASLTSRERQVMELLIIGHTNKDIASLLGLSTRTVEVYRAQLLKKMQVRNLAQLASMALAAAPSMAERVNIRAHVDGDEEEPDGEEP